MRICFLARANYPLLARRAEMMASLGHDVHIVSLQKGEIHNCSVHHVESNALLAKFKLHYFVASTKVKHILEKIKPDVIDLHGATSYGFYSNVIENTPFVVTIYGTELYSQANNFYPLRLIARRAIEGADLVYGSSQIIGSYINDILNIDASNKIKYRSWGISFERINLQAEERRDNVRNKYNVPKNSKVIFHNRLIAPLWQIPKLIEAMPKIVEHDNNVEFWFAYAPPNSQSKTLLEEYQSRVAEIGMEPYVKWLGSFAYDDFISLNHGADIFINIGKHDLLASSVLEAMSTGQIPVLSKLDVYNELVTTGENGFFLDEVTSNNIADTVVNILDNFQELQPRFSKVNKELVQKNYDEIRCTEWLAKQYETVINNYNAS